MREKDIWESEGRKMCRHGGMSHSLNVPCPSEPVRMDARVLIQWGDEEPREVGSFQVEQDSWRPPLELPTTPGSVIEARVAANNNSESMLWMRTGGSAGWVNDWGSYASSDQLDVARVLFDAGKDPQEYAPGLVDNSGEF